MDYKSYLNLLYLWMAEQGLIDLDKNGNIKKVNEKAGGQLILDEVLKAINEGKSLSEMPYNITDTIVDWGKKNIGLLPQAGLLSDTVRQQIATEKETIKTQEAQLETQQKTQQSEWGRALQNDAQAYNYPFDLRIPKEGEMPLSLREYTEQKSKIYKWAQQSQGLNQLNQTQLNQQFENQTQGNIGQAWMNAMSNQQTSETDYTKLSEQFESERKSVLDSLKTDENKNWYQIYETKKTQNPYQGLGKTQTDVSQQGQKAWADYLKLAPLSAQAQASYDSGIDYLTGQPITNPLRKQQIDYERKLAPAAKSLAADYDLYTYGKDVVDSAKKMGISAMTMSSWMTQMQNKGAITDWTPARGASEVQMAYYPGYDYSGYMQEAQNTAANTSFDTGGAPIDQLAAQRQAAEAYKQKMFNPISGYVQGGAFGGAITTPSGQLLANMLPANRSILEGYAAGTNQNWSDILSQTQKMLPKSASLGSRWRSFRQ